MLLVSVFDSGPTKSLTVMPPRVSWTALVRWSSPRRLHQCLKSDPFRFLPCFQSSVSRDPTQKVVRIIRFQHVSASGSGHPASVMDQALMLWPRFKVTRICTLPHEKKAARVQGAVSAKVTQKLVLSAKGASQHSASHADELENRGVPGPMVVPRSRFKSQLPSSRSRVRAF